MAAAITGGEVELVGAPARPCSDAVARACARPASTLDEDRAAASRVQRDQRRLHGVDVMTEPYPGFPTDLQAQIMALMTRRRGRRR